MSDAEAIIDFADYLIERCHQLWTCEITKPQTVAESVGFSINKHRLRCSTPLVSYRKSIRDSLVGCDSTLTDESGKDCRIIVNIEGTDGWPTIPSRVVAAMQDHQSNLALETTPYRCLQQPPGCWQFYNRSRGYGVQLLRSANSLPAWDTGAPLRNFLHWHLINKSLGLVHAGTLGYEGQGILLAGQGGSGKSGTVLAGLRHGLQSVGDDYVLASLDQGVTAHPLFQTLKQDPTGCERIGVKADSPLRQSLNWQGKHQFRIADLTGEGPVDQLQIRALCLPTITGSASTHFRPVNARDAFLSLAPSGLAQAPGDQGTLFGFCAAVARSLPTYRLELGSDPAEISASIRAFLQNQPR